MVDENKKVLVNSVTTEMLEWLEENIGEQDVKFLVSPNQVCVKHVFIPRPGHQNKYRTRGYHVQFQSEEDALSFKLRWL